MRVGDDDAVLNRLPEWVPEGARNYLEHTETGRSIRAIARENGCHASTVLRQVRRVEGLRDDLLIDEGLRRLGTSHVRHIHGSSSAKEADKMKAQRSKVQPTPDDSQIEGEARRVLRRLAEPGACLAVAKEMEKAVVVRDTSDGRTVRTAVVDRAVAEAMALKDWISRTGEGRIARYAIAVGGRAALKRMIAEADAARTGFSEAAAPFGDQHRDFAEREIGHGPDKPRQRVRYNLVESPLVALARRRDKDGRPFLSDDLVAAGERLREDFELAQMGPRITQNWYRFLAGGDHGAFAGDAGMAEGPNAARDRVIEALTDLGPGLGDVVLRCCCFLEGMEAAEKRMGWSARSGKIVLRIARQRLRRHYDEREGSWSPMIG